MPPAQQTAAASLALAIGLIVTTGLLGVLLWHDRKRRGTDLSPEDAAHYARQDSRRLTGMVVILLLAAGIFFGSRISPRVDGRANVVFLQVWVGVFLLIFFLLALGILDWLATRVYARRHREAITRERLELLRDELQRRAYPTNGKQTARGSTEEPL